MIRDEPTRNFERCKLDPRGDASLQDGLGFEIDCGRQRRKGVVGPIGGALVFRFGGFYHVRILLIFAHDGVRHVQ
ncbi:hypothetical protein [Hyphomicrobium sp. 2TAF46]|uniref:hypothetical protein n=1 Tax=Hyphomicrobium sp. 2TAF46 TaxID=3233019 RepID=UPI003F92E899